MRDVDLNIKQFIQGSISIKQFQILLLNLVLLTPVYATNNLNLIRVAVSSSPLSAPFIIAKEKGFFKDAGLNVEFEYFKGGHRTITALFEGKADIATSSEAVVMFNSFKRDDFSLFCTFVTSDNDVKIIARRDSGINTLEQLKGKKIGTIIGTSAHYFLSHTILMNGIPETELNIIALKPENSVNMLEDKTVDAIATWEPYAYLAKKKLGNAVTVINHDRAYIETFNAITMRDYAKNHQTELEIVTASLIKATNYMTKHITESQIIIARVLKKDPEIINSTWKDFSFSVSLNQWFLTSLESEARWAIEQNFAEPNTIPDYIEYINILPLKRVSPRNMNIFY